jgi:nucleotide-binding universal stress UspA family protein
MIGRVIVAYDGSALARAAFEHALALAEALKRPMVAVFTLEPVAPPPVIADPLVAIDPAPIPNFPVDFAEQREWGEEALEGLRARAAERGVALTPVLDEGALIDVLVDMANGDDLIALGKKGRFRESGVGSARVVTAFDGTSEGKRALVYASDVAYLLRWPLEVIALPCEGLDAAQSVERAEAALPQERGEVRVVASSAEGDCAKAIEHALGEQTEGALVVLGAYGESWLAELLFGSTAPKVLRKVAAPIILVR